LIGRWGDGKRGLADSSSFFSLLLWAFLVGGKEERVQFPPLLEPGEGFAVLLFPDFS
jgi:hypothetical protein